jgi:hypothetical protein
MNVSGKIGQLIEMIVVSSCNRVVM